MNDTTVTTPATATKTTGPARVNNRRNLAAIIAVAGCALVCSLPVIGGLIAGSFLDKVFDSPVVTVAVGSIAVIVVVGLVQRRSSLRSAGANDSGSDVCTRTGC